MTPEGREGCAQGLMLFGLMSVIIGFGMIILIPFGIVMMISGFIIDRQVQDHRWSMERSHSECKECRPGNYCGLHEEEAKNDWKLLRSFQEHDESRAKEAKEAKEEEDWRYASMSSPSSLTKSPAAVPRTGAPRSPPAWQEDSPPVPKAKPPPVSLPKTPRKLHSPWVSQTAAIPEAPYVPPPPPPEPPAIDLRKLSDEQLEEIDKREEWMLRLREAGGFEDSLPYEVLTHEVYFLRRDGCIDHLRSGFCPKCDQLILPKDKPCPHCNRKAETAQGQLAECVNCGEWTDAKYSECAVCGYPRLDDPGLGEGDGN